MGNDSVNVELRDGLQTAAVSRFQTLEHLELGTIHREHLGEEQLAELRRQCDAWHEWAMLRFQELAKAAGNEWELKGDYAEPGAWLAEDGSGFKPNLHIGGKLIRASEQRAVDVWCINCLVLHRGFPVKP